MYKRQGVVSVDLSKIRPMIALPMHPSNAFPIEELNANLKDCLLYTSDDGEGARPASAKSHTFSIPVRQLATSRSKTG